MVSPRRSPVPVGCFAPGAGSWRPFATARATPPTARNCWPLPSIRLSRGRGVGTLLVNGFLQEMRPTAAGRGPRRRGGRQRDRDRPVRAGRIRDGGAVRVASGHRVPSDAVARAAGDPAGVSTAVLVAVASAVITAVAVPALHRDRPSIRRHRSSRTPQAACSAGPLPGRSRRLCRPCGRSVGRSADRPGPTGRGHGHRGHRRPLRASGTACDLRPNSAWERSSP